MIIETFKVKIGPIYVSKDYYNFDYWLYRNGKQINYGNHDGSHSRNSSTMRSILKRGYAVELILSKYYA